LKKKGYFDENKKKSLPYLPTRIGIITSPSGSVVYDIINRVNDRFPMPLDIWPVSVQGTDASPSICKAINGFNEMIENRPDVIIIARGGGSTEDLMAFNDENLAVKVFESEIPIVTAIGHETDTTIIDLVSDLRASTPTAAAEKTVPVKKEIEILIKNLNLQLDNKIKSQLYIIKDKVEYLNKLLKAPSFIINMYSEKIQQAINNVQSSIQNKIALLNLNLSNVSNSINTPDSLIKIKKILTKELSKNLEKIVSEKYQNSNRVLNSNLRLLNSNSISKNLKKGYSVLMNKNKIIKSVNELKINSDIKAKLVDGELEVNIKKIN